MNEPNNSLPNEVPLEGWKEISSYLQRDESTARRWEREEGLPIRRHGHQKRASVYAYGSEIDAWRESRATEPPKRERKRLPFLLVAAALGIAALAIRFGPFLNPPDPLAEAAASTEVNLRQIWADPDVDVLGSISPDGRLLSYVHWDTGDLAVRNLETGENRLLTGKTETWGKDDQHAHVSVFAPDSKRICYVWFDFDSEAPGLYELRIIDATSDQPETTVRTVYRDEDVRWPQPVAWFPDGKRILATLLRTDGTSTLAVVSLETGEIQVLRSFKWGAIGRAALSPDGRYVAYNRASAPDETDNDVYVTAVDGSTEVKLVEHPAFDDVIAWTPDGRSLIFRSDRSGDEDLWIVDFADGSASGPETVLRRKVSIAQPIGWAPGGRLLFGTRTGDHNVFTASIDFETGKLLEQPAVAVKTYEGHNYWPTFSPDGSSIAYLSRRANYDYLGNRSPTLVIQALDGIDQREFALGLGRFSRAAWSPQGDKLLLSGQLGREMGLFVFDVESGRARLAVPMWGADYLRPYWNQDGTGVYYTRQEDGQPQPTLIEHDLETGATADLFELRDGRAVASPDGQRFALTWRDRKAGVTRLLVRSTKTDDTRVLVEASGSQQLGASPHWTPDGQRIVFWRRNLDFTRRSVLWSIRADGQDLRETELSSRYVGIPNLEELSIHPDGKRVAYSAGNKRFEIWSLGSFLPDGGASE